MRCQKTGRPGQRVCVRGDPTRSLWLRLSSWMARLGAYTVGMTANRAPDSTPRAPLWAWAIGLLALVVAYLPTLRWLGMTWLGGSYHSHGAAVPLIAAWIASRSLWSTMGSLTLVGTVEVRELG